MEEMTQEFKDWYEKETGWCVEDAPSHDVTALIWLAWKAGKNAGEDLKR
ncbi:hypothetical protein [Enterobacter cancerogenus]